ncbi:MAG: pentapeptide repeat-containing protein, partial [Rickettsiales bacterium]
MADSTPITREQLEAYANAHRKALREEQKGNPLDEALQKARQPLKVFLGATPDLRGTDLKQMNLQLLDISGSLCQDADFRGATLTGAKLSHANLQNAKLRRAVLQNADLSHTDLTGIDAQDA